MVEVSDESHVQIEVDQGWMEPQVADGNGIKGWKSLRKMD